jgi:hypothetical protein
MPASAESLEATVNHAPARPANRRRKLQENGGICPGNLQIPILRSRRLLCYINGLVILHGDETGSATPNSGSPWPPRRARDNSKRFGTRSELVTLDIRPVFRHLERHLDCQRLRSLQRPGKTRLSLRAIGMTSSHPGVRISYFVLVAAAGHP